MEFSPTDDISGEARTHERSAAACQARCVLVPPCGFFSYWADEGGCHLSGGGAVPSRSPGVVSGPARCSGRNGRPQGLHKIFVVHKTMV